MCKVIAITNQKGGCAKTNVTVNLGIGLAREGKKVALIDNDAQGSLTASLGYEEPDELNVTLANIMMNVINDEENNPEYGFLHHEEGVSFIPANVELSGLEISLINVISRETILRSYIETIRDQYDYILIDCAPSLGMLTINALVAADAVIIPVPAAYLPVKGLVQLLKTISMVKRRLNRKLQIEGILITMADFRTNFAKDISAKLHEAYDLRLAPFDIAELREFMSYDEMELDMIGDQRTALFIVISDTDDTFNFVVAMMYSQMFNLLCDRADDVHHGRLPYHVRILADEFANIGQIPKFDKLIATIRSREISASIILQSQSQLKTIYKDAAETIIGNCDSMLFLGGKESSTLKEISETLGKETIDLYNTSDSRGQSRSYGMNYQKTGKDMPYLFVKSSVALNLS